MVVVVLSDSFNTYWNSSEKQIVKGNVVVFKYSCVWVQIVKEEVKLRNREKEVLIKEIHNEIRDTYIIKSTMNKDQIPQMFKLMNSKIWVLCCSYSFFSKNPNSNVCFKKHWYVICTISNWKSDFWIVISSNHSDNFSFLPRRNSTSDNSFTCLSYLDKSKFKIFIWCNFT